MTLFDVECVNCHNIGLANAEESTDEEIQKLGEETEESSESLYTLLFCPKCLTGREHFITEPLAPLCL